MGALWSIIAPSLTLTIKQPVGTRRSNAIIDKWGQNLFSGKMSVLITLNLSLTIFHDRLILHMSTLFTKIVTTQCYQVIICVQMCQELSFSKSSPTGFQKCFYTLGSYNSFSLLQSLDSNQNSASKQTKWTVINLPVFQNT